jgi:hypothetical protein
LETPTPTSRSVSLSFKSSGAELKKMELPYEMNDKLAQRVSHVHSYIRDFAHPELDPNLVYEHICGG